MVRKTTSIKIDQSLWKKVKKYCIDKEIGIYEYLEEVLRKDLEKNGGK